MTEFHCVCNLPTVRRHLFDDEPDSMGSAGTMIGSSERDFAGGSVGVGLFGLRRRGAGGLIGFCGFFVAEGVGEPELAYALLPSCWGRGFATEAARAVAGHVLAVAGFRQVLIATDGANDASVQVIECLGARPLGKVARDFSEVVYFEIGAGTGGSGGGVDSLKRSGRLPREPGPPGGPDQNTAEAGLYRIWVRHSSRPHGANRPRDVA